MNNPSSFFSRLSAICMYSGFNSNPMYLRLNFRATMPVVPEPINGSRTIPFSGHPAKMQSATNFSGNVAKCASCRGCVGIVHTSLLFRNSLSIYALPLFELLVCYLHSSKVLEWTIVIRHIVVSEIKHAAAVCLLQQLLLVLLQVVGIVPCNSVETCAVERCVPPVVDVVLE